MTAKQVAQQQAEDAFEAQGTWSPRRHTVCQICDRRTVTDAFRVCRRCSLATFEVLFGSFEDDEDEQQEEAA